MRLLRLPGCSAKRHVRPAVRPGNGGNPERWLAGYRVIGMEDHEGTFRPQEDRFAPGPIRVWSK